MLAPVFHFVEGLTLLAERERKRIYPMSAEQNAPPPKRQNMTRISSVTAAQDSWRPKDAYYPPMKSISATIEASPCERVPAVQPPAEPLSQPEGTRATGTRKDFPVSKHFETAKTRMTFSAEWKGPFHRPRKQCFNDDVCLEAYVPAALSFADKQRKGIREAFEGCSSMEEHIERAVKQPFPLASETPIPRETRKAAQFVAENDPHLVAEFGIPNWRRWKSW